MPKIEEIDVNFKVKETVEKVYPDVEEATDIDNAYKNLKNTA